MDWHFWFLTFFVIRPRMLAHPKMKEVSLRRVELFLVESVMMEAGTGS